MHLLFIPFAFILGALGRRVAGGVLNQWFAKPGERVTGDFPTRLFFGLTMGLAALMGGANLWLALGLIPAAFVGTTTGNFESLAMGRGNYSFTHDFLGMTAHGAASAVVPFLVMFGSPCHWEFMVGACLACAPIYALSFVITEKLGSQALRGAPAPVNPRALPIGLQGGDELAEALWGGAMGVGFLLSFAV